MNWLGMIPMIVGITVGTILFLVGFIYIFIKMLWGFRND
jgi:hypothetical protein